MKQMQKIKIERLDYQKQGLGRGYFILDPLSHTSEINDINEVYTIQVTGDNLEEFINMMPKSHQWKLRTGMNCDSFKSYKFAEVKFNTFFHNDLTGEKNESAIKRREKVIKKLLKLGL